MKFSSSVIATAILAQSVSAHYFFDKLIVDGKESNSLQYIRENTRPAKYNPTKWANIRDDMTPDLTDFRCNKGAFTNAGKTQTMEIKAGSKLGMKLAVGATFQHPGPTFVYMSKAPTTAQKYEGDGDWFKIAETGVCDTKKDFTKDAWCSWDKNVVDFTVPKDTPDGEYLIRSEHLALHGAHAGQAEFYYACAQVKVTGGGSGTPGPMVKFPGAYKKTDPEVNFSLWSGYKPYTMPGPAVWTGGNSGASTSNTSPKAESSSITSKAPASTPVSTPSKQVTHDAENCTGGKAAGTRRSLREMIFSA